MTIRIHSRDPPNLGGERFKISLGWAVPKPSDPSEIVTHRGVVVRRDVWFAVDDCIQHAVTLVRTVEATLVAQDPVIILQVSRYLPREPLHRATSARKRDIVDVSGVSKFVAVGEPTNTLINGVEHDVTDRDACRSALR